MRERLLPGRGAGAEGADHYVVLVGLDGEDVAYHDPALPAPGEAPRSAPMGAMLAAMAASSRPFTAVAVAPAEGRYPVRVAAAPRRRPGARRARRAAPAPAVGAGAGPAAGRRAGAPRARAGARRKSGPSGGGSGSRRPCWASPSSRCCWRWGSPTPSTPLPARWGRWSSSAAGGEHLGQLTLSRWRHTVRWSIDDCARNLPAVDTAALRADRGPVVAGRTTVRLGLVSGDGHVVSRILQHRESCPVSQAPPRSVTYLGLPAGSGATSETGEATGTRLGWQPGAAG